MLFVGGAVFASVALLGRSVSVQLGVGAISGLLALVEFLVNMVGLPLGATLIAKIGEVRHRPWREAGMVSLVLLNALVLVGFYQVFSLDLDMATKSAFVMVGATPLSFWMSLNSHRIVAILLSTVSVYFCLGLVAARADSITDLGAVMMLLYFNLLSASTQLMHQINADRRTAMALNEAYANELEQRVAERTEKLERATQRAQAADKAKSEFLAVMSHELRTPMNGVLGMAEVLQESVADDRQRMFVDVIQNSATALVTIIDDILDMSKLESGKLGLSGAPFDPTQLAGDFLDPIIGEAVGKGLAVSIRVDPHLPEMIQGDAERLRQVVHNFFENAVKFTEAGSISLNIGEIEGPDGRPALRVVMRDTGRGVEPGLRDKIFESFSQADASVTRREGGLGLGLAICRGLAELMDGAIGVDPRPRGGSEFWFECPLDAASRNDACAGLRARLSGARVLLIEEDPVQRRILSETLIGAGTTLVEDGEGAVDLTILPLGEAAPSRGAVIRTGAFGASGEGVLARPYRLDLLRAALSAALRPERAA